MTVKEIVLETIRALLDDCSLEKIAERVEFMAAVQKGLDHLDRGEGTPHDEVKTVSLMAYKLIWSSAARDDLHDVVVFIARDNPNRAMSFGYELIPRQLVVKAKPVSGKLLENRVPLQ